MRRGPGRRSCSGKIARDARSTRKLLRDLVHLRGQMVAISLVVACGVAVFVTTRTAYDSLLIAQATYYADYRFADVFAQPQARARRRWRARIAAIPGVGVVRTRIVFDVTLDVPGLAEPATGRLVSIPERRVPMLNDLYLRRGRYVEPGRRDEVLVGEAFATANHLDVGDTRRRRPQRALAAAAHRRHRAVARVRLRDPRLRHLSGQRRFGVLVDEPRRDGAGVRHGRRVQRRGAVARAGRQRSGRDRAARPPPRALRRPRCLRARDQISHRFLSDEIAQNRIFGTILPAIFLGVAAFLLNIVLSRLVAMQRDQIAVLKAFGYGDLDVARALPAVRAGGGAGRRGRSAPRLGLWLGALINRMYVDFYRFPVLRYEAGPAVIALAVAMAGGGGAARRAGRGAARPGVAAGRGDAARVAAALPRRACSSAAACGWLCRRRCA